MLLPPTLDPVNILQRPVSDLHTKKYMFFNLKAHSCLKISYRVVELRYFLAECLRGGIQKPLLLSSLYPPTTH